jgi:xanthine dehydrogenase YagS FAD-binding subunit
MKIFELTRADDSGQAIAAAAKATTAQQGAEIRLIAGGTNLVDYMKLNVETPRKLVDVNHLPFDKIENLPDGGLKIGATVRNTDLANNPTVRKNYSVLSEALLSGASPQLRNMATTAGNLLQRTRCMYFRDTAMPCNKREPGSGCAAITGINRSLAILGTSEHCIASNPSDMNVAMAALEATIQIRGPKGERSVPIGDFHLLPGNTPNRETVLEPGDLITHVTLPPPSRGNRSRSLEAEAELAGQSTTQAVFQKAAEAAVRDAKRQSQNGFKVELAKRCLTHALTLVTQTA